MGNLLVTVANVYPKDKSASFHVTSFIKIVNDKIISLDEYWADDSDAPQWRLDNHIGTVIKCEPDRIENKIKNPCIHMGFCLVRKKRLELSIYCLKP